MTKVVIGISEQSSDKPVNSLFEFYKKNKQKLGLVSFQVNENIEYAEEGVNKSDSSGDWIRLSTAAKERGISRQAMHYRLQHTRPPLRTKVVDNNLYVDRNEIERLKIREEKGERKKRGRTN